MDAAPQAAAALVCDLNMVRAQNGRAPLRWNWRLWTAAQEMAADMAAKHYFSHDMPDGRTLADRVLPTRYTGGSDDWLLLENLGWAAGSDSAPAALSDGWMNSYGHRENILDADVRDVAVALSEGSPGGDYGDGIFYVADFGDPGTPPHRARSSHRRRRQSRDLTPGGHGR